MAIASALLTVSAADAVHVRSVLSARHDIVELQPLPENSSKRSGFAVVFECPSHCIPTVLAEMQNIEGITEVNLVFANYEDDIDAEGYIPVPSVAGKKQY